MAEHRARVRTPSGRVSTARLSEDRVVLLEGPLWGPGRETGEVLGPEEVRLLCPVTPSKVVGIGRNYRAHAAELGNAVPTVPKIFLMAPSAVIGPEDPIPLPPGDLRIDHEAELGVVIGARASRLPVDRAHEVVLGLTCVNDVTCRDHQRFDGTFTRGKSRDGFCPIGPVVALGHHWRGRAVRCRVDGVLRQDGVTDDMVFGVAQLIAFVSEVMTLEPGDVIATGTPAGVGPLAPGQRVEVEVDGVGVLRNPVVARG